jgi:hypothetical protein
MGAAAQLQRYAGHVHHPHHIAVISSRLALIQDAKLWSIAHHPL